MEPNLSKYTVRLTEAEVCLFGSQGERGKARIQNFGLMESRSMRHWYRLSRGFRGIVITLMTRLDIIPAHRSV